MSGSSALGGPTFLQEVQHKIIFYKPLLLNEESDVVGVKSNEVLTAKVQYNIAVLFISIKR